MTLNILYQALEQGNPKPLEELAIKAGYTKIFEPLSTPVLSLSCNPRYAPSKDIHPEEFRNSVRYYRDYFWMHHQSSEDECPRHHWTSKYQDIFTRIKETEHGAFFVDCWKPKKQGNSQIVIMKGRFDKKEDYRYDFDERMNVVKRDIDEDAYRLLYLARFRKKYPPLSRLEIALGPSPQWVLGRAMADSLLLSLGYISYAVAHYEVGHGEPSATGTYLGIVLASAFEIFFHIWRYRQIGNGFYKKDGVKLQKEAIKSLVAET